MLRRAPRDVPLTDREYIQNRNPLSLVTFQEFAGFRPVAKALIDHQDSLFGKWHELYSRHFGANRSLSSQTFDLILGRGLEDSIRSIIDADLDRYTSSLSRVGTKLAVRQVPFTEVLTSLHLFWEVVRTDLANVFAFDHIEALTLFSKFCHHKAILIADAYHREIASSSQVKIRSVTHGQSRADNSASLFHGIVGHAASMIELFRKIEAAGRTRGSVLIAGESGTGKELIARAIHACSPEPKGRFMALNCAAIPRELMESELFGHRRGAFSGASNDYLGIFRASDGGTLLLDEITEMSPDIQGKLLRALQERTVRPVGSTDEIPVDIRLISSTNRVPEEAVRSGHFRQDLYYRLQAAVLHVPPLRERIEDLALLIPHFIDAVNARGGREPLKGVAPDALDRMKMYRWPGNVRELSNVIEAAYTFGTSSTIGLKDMPAAMIETLETAQMQPVAQPSNQTLTYAETEREAIVRALEQTRGNKLRAAALLQISRKRLYSRMAKYGLI
jgi:transcriptional regulator with PAS, ATPase and Fis domain